MVAYVLDSLLTCKRTHTHMYKVYRSTENTKPKALATIFKSTHLA